MRRVKRGEAEQTIVDLTDSRKLIVMVSTSKARQIIYNPNNGSYNPDFSKEPMVLTPELYITGSPTNVIATAETVKWYVRPNTLGQRIPIVNNDTYSIGNDFKLTISKNIMKDMLTMEFILEVIYKEPDSDFRTTIPHHMELVNISMGEDGRNGVDGIDGLDGERGLPGPKGADGESSYTHLAYANNATGTQDFSLSYSNRSYIGMYVDNLENDSTNPSDYKWTKVEGMPGDKGIQGPKGADGRTPYFHIAYATNEAGTERFSVSDSVGKTYIGQYTDYIENDSTKPSDYSWTLIKGEDGVDGYTPIKGVDYFDGNDGISIVEIKEYYLASNKDAGITITGYDWKETFQPISETAPYLWNYERIEYSNGLRDMFGPNIIGRYASDGEKGEAGRGIASITEYYLTSSEDIGILVEDNEYWSTTFQQTTPTNRYLWNYEEIAYTDGTKDIVGPSIIGTHGMKGDSPIVAYLSNDSHSIPTDADGLNANYTNAYTEMYIMDGIEDDTDSYTFSAKESSGIVGNIEGNKYTVTSLSGDLAEVRITATKGNFTISKVFTVTKSKKGTDGSPGDDSILYQLNTDTLVVIKDIDDVYSQDSVSLTSVMKVGSEDYKNNPVYFRIYEQKVNPLTVDTFSELSMKDQVDNREYILSLYGKPRLLQYESFMKESHIDYKLGTDIMSIFVEIYEDENFTKILDSQSIAVIAEPKPNYKLEMQSTNGNGFLNGVINTELYVTLYRGEEDITDSTDAKHFIWTRVSSDTNSDTVWNDKYKAGAKRITVTKDDVNMRARFSCNFVK